MGLMGLMGLGPFDGAAVADAVAGGAGPEPGAFEDALIWAPGAADFEKEERR